MRILEVMTEHTTPFKILIEVLKDLLPESNIEFRMDTVPEITDKSKNKKAVKDKKYIEDDDLDLDSDEELESDTEESSSEELSDSGDEEKAVQKKIPDRSGMRIMAVDSTKTVLINLKLDAKNFTEFKCKTKKLVLGVNLVYFHKLIKSMDKDDNLTLYVEHDDKNYLKIRIDNPEKNSKSTFKLKLLDLGNDPMSVPDITFDAVVTMSSTDFHKICREMNQIADFMEIKCLSNKIIFTCKGDYAERTTEFTTDNMGEGINIHHAGGVGSKDSPLIIQGIYELKNLVLFAKCASLCNDIQIYMKNNYPLVIKYTVATLGRILLCLTPINENTTNNANYSDEDDYYSDEDIELLAKHAT